MTTPNEELITDLQQLANEIEISYRIESIEEAVKALQSQAERIKELEEAAEESSVDAVIIQYHEAAIKRLKIENDTLRAQLADAELHTKQVERGLDKATAQLAAIRAREPVLVVEKEPDYWSGGHFHEGSKPHIKPTKVWCLPIGTQLFTHPMPARPQDHEIRELVDRLTAIAKEYGQMQQLRERIAQEIRPFTFTKPAQDKSNNYLNGYCTGRTDLLKEQAAPQAQDVTELVEALEMIVSTHQGHCEHHVGVSKHSYNLADIAEEALSKYKGAKQ